MLAPQLAEEYLLSSGTVGTLFFLLALGFGLSLFFSQFLSATLSHRKVISLSAIGCGVLLLLVPWIDQVYGLGALLLFLGGFGGLFIPSAIAYLSHLFEKVRLGRAIGLFSSFQTLAMIMAPIVGGFFAGRGLFYLLGLSLLFLGLLFLLFATSHEKGSYPSLDFFKEAIDSNVYRTIFVFNSLAIGLNIGIYLLAPSYFVGLHGISESYFYPILSTTRVIGLFTPILFGFLSDFLQFRLSITRVLFMTGACTCLIGFLRPEDALLLFCLQSPLAIALTTLVYIAISKVSPEGRRASLISLFASTSFLIGTGLIPQAIGILGDWNLYRFGFILLGSAAIFFSLLKTENFKLERE